VRTLHRNSAALWKLWRGSDECKTAKAAGLFLGRSAWYTQLHCEHYEFRKPCKRVDVCDTCLKFIRKGATQVKQTLHSVRASLAAADDTYWQNWRTTTKDPCTSSALKEVIDFIKAHAAQPSERRLALGMSARLKLHDAEADAQHAVKQQLEIVQLYEHHYQSVQRQHTAAESLLSLWRRGSGEKNISHCLHRVWSTVRKLRRTCSMQCSRSSRLRM
jgi:hypothetical protein